MFGERSVGVFRFTRIERPIDEYVQLCDECLDKMHDWHPGHEFETSMQLSTRRLMLGGVQITLHQVDFVFHTATPDGHYQWGG